MRSCIKYLPFSLLSLFLQLLTFIQFRIVKETLHFRERLEWQIIFLLGLSLLLSLVIFFLKHNRLIPYLIKLIIAFLISYSLGNHLWLLLTYSLSLLTEGIYFTFPANSFLLLLALIPQFISRIPRSVFHYNISSVAQSEILFSLSYSFIFFCSILFFSFLLKRTHKIRKIADEQDESIARIAKANLDYQNYNIKLELDTLKKERKRISREIHDTVGYSLTNIRVMLEAAELLFNERETDDGRTYLKKSMNEARQCLEETRSAMRLLRSKELRAPKGLKSFFDLIKGFGEATGLNVSIEFGNSPNSFGKKIDSVILRFIQEGLINSFRHGKANRIRVYFWIEKNILRLSIQDNGKGTEEMKEGIGLSGMRERLREISGNLHYNNIESGFEVCALIPLEGKKNDTSITG